MRVKKATVVCRMTERGQPDRKRWRLPDGFGTFTPEKVVHTAAERLTSLVVDGFHTYTEHQDVAQQTLHKHVDVADLAKCGTSQVETSRCAGAQSRPKCVEADGPDCTIAFRATVGKRPTLRREEVPTGHFLLGAL